MFPSLNADSSQAPPRGVGGLTLRNGGKWILVTVYNRFNFQTQIFKQ